MPIIDNAVYVDGQRIADPKSLDETFEYLRAHRGVAWIALVDPTDDELTAVAGEFGLHPLAVEDARLGHQRAKFERYGDMHFVVLRPAWYVDETETVEFGETHVFVGRDFVVTVRHGEHPHLKGVRNRLEADPALLGLGPFAILYAILDEVVDRYAPIVEGVQNDIDEIEDGLFGDEAEGLSRRIYRLSEEVIAFQRAVEPLTGMLQFVRENGRESTGQLELQRLLRDVNDHVLQVTERLHGFRELLGNALTVHATIVAQRQNATALAQNEQLKKVSGWAAIALAPTIIGGVYGMNFRDMPELDWSWGYPAALALMAATSIGLYLVFKRRHWL